MVQVAILRIISDANGETAVKKNAVVDLVRAMPDEIDVDDLIDRLFLLAKLKRVRPPLLPATCSPTTK